MGAAPRPQETNRDFCPVFKARPCPVLTTTRSRKVAHAICKGQQKSLGLAMKKMDVLQHAANIAKLMQSISDAITSELERVPFDPIVQPRPLFLFDILEETDATAAGLDAIGLDDMSLRRIVIELNHDRTCFKIWTPFSESFVKELKRRIPKHARGWDADERCWRVNTYWFGNAQALLPEHFPDLERSYTGRAIRMCEQLAHEDEREAENQNEIDDDEPEEETPRKRQQKPKRSSGYTSKRKSRNNHEEEEAPPKKRKSNSKTDDEPKSKDDKAYAVLGVSPDAPDEVVKAAYKALARKHHTDLGGSEEKMKKINEAFEHIKELRGSRTPP